jgi:3-hydroxyisobutyrate dehydrogenase
MSENMSQRTMSQPNVAILGLGIMGSGMANRLLGAKFPLTVYNRNREKCVPFGSVGAFIASSPHEAASRSQIILSMVADDAASRDVWLGEDGALNSAAPNAILIECSTLSVGWVKELATAATNRGCQFLDAPVTGTKPHAASGELLFLVGGSAETVDAARPVFAVLGRDVVHLGPVGSGALMKLINNFLCGVQAASFGEALAMINTGGLDRDKAISILTNGAPGSGIVKRVAERVSSNDFTPNFALRWMAKDLSYAVGEASKNGISLQTAAAALSLFQNAIADGHGDEDFSAVTKSSKKWLNS